MTPTASVGERIRAQVREVEEIFPDLAGAEEGDGGAVVSGRLPLVDADGSVFDTWVVEIQVPATFPGQLPLVREFEGRIPREIDRHINVGGQDGQCCIGVEADLYLKLGRDFTLLDFIRGPVTSFFFGQYLVELGEDWPAGERPHGRAGVVDFFAELLAVPPGKVARWVGVLAEEHLDASQRCPCGRKRQLKACHFRKVYSLRSRIPYGVARAALDEIREWRRRKVPKP